ncbi:TIGR02449 family protein [Methyloglobulus morosus KoM1]|jgi:cell division protein ZapB|uniref:TIGR02449 family protein n=1 Tax=Methyloglobulus morosus KoM1 TaxID=1116472 RepID=V5DX34_9GAMM|nr:TIGR02449 family protein [Methyloglobulus morosus]ESS71886.1 TIGR02449 family protein [Methyloglobulus morosus KoM1]
MTEKEPYQSLEIKDLEKKLDQLIELYHTVETENEALKSKQETLVREKAELLEKTTIARNRVEAMISRLKTMGQGS